MKKMWLEGVANKKPVCVKEIPAASDIAGNVTVRLFQVMRVRPLVFGYKRGRGLR